MAPRNIYLFHIEITKINNEYENIIENKISNNQNPYLTKFQKEIEARKEEKTTILIVRDKNEIKKEPEKTEDNIILSNISNYSYNSILNINFLDSTESTCDNSKIIINNDINQNLSNYLNEIVIINKFNTARANYYQKNSLYDISLASGNIQFFHPPKYFIDDKLYSYVYANNLNTYTVTMSGFLSNDNKNIESNIVENNDKDRKYDITIGLYFCGREIPLENGNKKCAKNIFLCKCCMEYNKKVYNLKHKYLININGRVSKINKGTYHCFGHFSVNNQLEDCITKFTCEACKLLNLNSKYYN